MTKALRSTDLATITSVPQLLELVDEVQRSHQPHLLKRQDEQVAMIVPIEPAKPAKPAPKRKRRTGILTRDDPLFRMAGTGNSGIPGGISGNKYAYFRRAFGIEEPR